MQIASAVSLPGPGQEFPNISNPPFARRTVRVPVTRRLAPAPLPSRHVPRAVPVDKPPRGRILVAADRPGILLEVQRILRDAGYRAVGPAGTPQEAARLAARPLDAAIVDPASARAEAIAQELAHADVPIVWLAEDSPVRAGEILAALDRVFRRQDEEKEAPAAPASFYPVPPSSPVWPRVFPQL